MKTVEKEIRKVITLYEAFDGEDFEEKEDALWHEYEALIKLEELKVLNNSGEESNLSYSSVVYFETQRALECFIELCEYEGYYYEGLTPTAELGWYFWENDEWVSPQKRLNMYRNEINEILVNCGGVPIE